MTALVATRPAARLRAGTAIAATFHDGRASSARTVAVHARDRGPEEDDGPARVAVIASRRVGNAVSRNRAKRLLREAIRVTPVTGGVDLVLVARPAGATARLAEVVADVRRCLIRLALLDQMPGDGPGAPR